MKWIFLLFLAAYAFSTQIQPVDQTLCIAKLGYMETTSAPISTKVAIALILRSSASAAGLPPCQVVNLDKGTYLSSYLAAIHNPQGWNGIVWSEDKEAFLKRSGADSSFRAADLVLSGNLYTAVYHFDACSGKANWKASLNNDSYDRNICFYHKNAEVLADLRYKVSLIK